MRKQMAMLWGLTVVMAVLALLTSLLLAQGTDNNILMWAFILIFGLMVILIPPFVDRRDEGQAAN
jgi:hypothetical protein